jgi:hypothetical protein
MARKASSVPVLASKGPASAGVEHTIRSRKIDNGHVVTTSTYNPNTGDYQSNEVFSKTAPVIVPPRLGAERAPPSSLAGAIKALK